MFASIRSRLTTWYFCILAAILIFVAAGAWFGMWASVLIAVNHDLQLRIDDVQQFIERQLAVSPTELVDEFQEQAGLGLGGGLMEVRDGDGRVLYRSARLGAAELSTSTGARNTEFTTKRSGDIYARVGSRTVVVRGRRFTILVAESLRAFQQSREEFEGILVLVSAVALLLAALGGFWMSGKALAPVDRITNEARQISISNLSTRLQLPPARDELHRLATTLNDMLERIDGGMRRMIQFTADASHELRTPLTLIHSAAEYSLRRERTADELQEAMRKIVRESGRTSRLVYDLLFLARADSAQNALDVAPADLCVSVREAAEQAVTLAELKGIQVSTSLPADPISVEADEDALLRLWLILLDNAVKYTNEGGRIVVLVRVTDSHAQVEVTDTGVGIAEPDLPHIFDRFWRADKVRSRSMGGAGLGLSIAHWIVEQHHGKIEVRSEPARGSEFVVRFPRYPAAQVTGQKDNGLAAQISHRTMSKGPEL